MTKTTDERIESIKSSRYVSFDEKMNKYLEDYKLSKEDAEILLSSKIIYEYFDSTLNYIKEPKIVYNWITSELIRFINKEDFNLSEENFASLLKAVIAGEINNNSAKDILVKIVTTNKNVKDVIKDFGLEQESSEEFLNNIIDEILKNNPDEHKRIMDGETKLISFFVGQAMKETKGKGNPKIINEILRNRFNVNE